MASELTKDQLRTEIHAILKDADLTTTSTKKVRTQLEEKFDVDLTARKKEIDQLVMEYISKDDEESDGGEEEASDDDAESEDEKPKKRASAGKRGAPAKKKKKQASSDESEASEESGSDEDYRPDKNVKVAKAKKRKGASDSDSDEEWKAPRAAPKPKKAGGAKKEGGAKKGGTGFTRPYKLSDDLAAIVGVEEAPRHAVVKKIWAIIKEKNLYDPKNKQFAICNPELLKVMGVKRFRTFGMMKYLRPHFLD